MAWHVARNGDRSLLLDFVARNEWRCVAFSSRIRREGRSLLTANEGGAIIIDRQRGRTNLELTGAVMFTRNGLALPVLGDEATFCLSHDEQPELVARRYGSRLNTIMGVRSSVRSLERWYRKRPEIAMDYHLMVADLRSWQPPASPQFPTVVVRKAFPEDTDLLFPLQKGYELEEVYLNPATFDDRRSRSLLRRNLRDQVVFSAEIRGVPIAKAATNARGYKADQIGGVFTRPDLRGRGLGALVLTTLLSHIRDEGTVFASLFVKRTNQAAIVLYEKLGFQIKDQYRISYYTRF